MSRSSFCALVGALFVSFMLAPAASAQSEQSQAVEDGGISIPGWTGKVDPQEASNGMTVESAKLSQDGGTMMVSTGPSITYWNPENTASGSYTVMASFHEPEYMTGSSHPHPYGIFIGGQDMGTDNQTFLYCAAYGNGSFIVRGFGPDTFRMNGNRPEAHEAVNEADGQDQPVSQDIAVTVTDESVQCSINGTVVASYPKSEIVGEGKLKSTDGVWGIRFGHNTIGTVSGLHKM